MPMFAGAEPRGRLGGMRARLMGGDPSGDVPTGSLQLLVWNGVD